MAPVIREAGMRHDALFGMWKLLNFREPFYQLIAQFWQIRVGDFSHHDRELGAVQLATIELG
jgi:hypothetical protein